MWHGCSTRKYPWAFAFFFYTLRISHKCVTTLNYYCLPIWSLTTKEVTEPIARLYNRALKIHSNLPKWTHHCTALTQSHALSFQNCIYSHAITFYFQLQHSTSQTLISLLPTHNMPQVRVTRSVSMALHPVPAYNNGYGQRSFTHTFTKVWNGIPHHIRALQSITQFKKAYKLLLLNTDLYRSLSVLSLLSIWLSYWCLTCYVPVMCCIM
jgi:hypothetical protein